MTIRNSNGKHITGGAVRCASNILGASELSELVQLFDGDVSKALDELKQSDPTTYLKLSASRGQYQNMMATSCDLTF